MHKCGKTYSKTLFTWSGGPLVQWGKFLLFCVPQSVKTKETYPTRPGSPTPCKQALNLQKAYKYDQTNIQLRVSWIFDLIFWTTAIVDARNVG